VDFCRYSSFLRHNITEILLKVALNNINTTLELISFTIVPGHIKENE
jgi:hypothetical protein